MNVPGAWCIISPLLEHTAAAPPCAAPPARHLRREAGVEITWVILVLRVTNWCKEGEFDCVWGQMRGLWEGWYFYQLLGPLISVPKAGQRRCRGGCSRDRGASAGQSLCSACGGVSAHGIPRLDFGGVGAPRCSQRWRAYLYGNAWDINDQIPLLSAPDPTPLAPQATVEKQRAGENTRKGFFLSYSSTVAAARWLVIRQRNWQTAVGRWQVSH